MISVNKEEIRNKVIGFLKNHELAVVATISDNKPEAATVGFLTDEELNFFFMSKKTSRKIENLKTNSNIAIVIGTEKGSNTLQVEGDAKVFFDSDQEFAQVVTKISNIEPIYYGPLLKMGGTDFAIVKVKPNWIRWLDFNDLTGKEEFFQLIP